jgi:hypothetical protein
VLYCKARFDGHPKIVVPQLLVPALFAYFHDSPVGGHLGVRKTFIKFANLSFGSVWMLILLPELELAIFVGLVSRRIPRIMVCCRRMWRAARWRKFS